MRVIRAEVRALFSRWAEPLFGLSLAGFGLWILSLGGWVLGPAGAAIIALGLAWALLGLRRMRFAGRGDAPGLVQLDESRITFMGPTLGGSISVDELIEIRLLSLRGRRAWRLRQGDGQVLLVPIDSTGAEALFDAFATLPGLSSADLVAALQGDSPASGQSLPALDGGDRLVWRRAQKGLAPV
ncbi:hypothetical protein Q9295_13675 [Xinfangfangia sp. CPCC 101601]|uniref:Uncharacterized protein n=1 Tax=Pseudogemmobacter lacusdianii TaxID=3069608 RepID=A0ABU0W0Y8_9RHOB|nr:hypothetical protein [Xinfangfangia sp. CPCC 101601]MDQ2067423.1 hypothetical protein [Xinfangfangia sp. CPCC 101601]